MATLRKERKLAALNKENCEEHLRSNLAQNSKAPRSQEDYITQVSEEIEGRVGKRFSKEFSWTESRIIDALSRLDEFLLNPLIESHCGFVPDTSRKTLGTNQDKPRRKEALSQSDPHPDASVSQSQTTRNAGPDDAYDSCYLNLRTKCH